jgi:hypothetical protein
MTRLDLAPLTLSLVLGTVLSGCGGGDGDGGTPPATRTIAKASANSGDAQSGAVAQALSLPLQVVVTEGGAAKAGATVTWSTTAPGGALQPATSSTDPAGVASATWTLGTVSGSQTAQAALSGATGSPVTFTATAAPAAAAALERLSGDEQTGVVGTQLAAPLVAKVSDQFGNGVSGVPVEWAASDGSVSAPSVPTDQSGASAVTVTLPATAGPITITADAGALIGSLTYTAVVIALLRMDPAHIRRHERPTRQPPVLHSLAEGVSYARRTPYVFWSLVLLGGVAAFGFNFQILLPIFAQTVLALGADGYGALFAALGIGSLSGSLTLAFMRRRRALRLMIGGGLVFAVLVIALGLSRTPWLAYPFVVGAGYFSMLMINTINATVQANVTDQLRGRVMALYVTVFAGTAPLGGLVAGAMAQAWGAAAAFVIGALLSMVVIGLVAWRLRGARGAPMGGSVAASAR